MLKRIFMALGSDLLSQQARNWQLLDEAFKTWQLLSWARDNARLNSDPKRYLRLDLLTEMTWRRYIRRLEQCISPGKAGVFSPPTPALALSLTFASPG
jgi:hypothetical protein